MSGELKITAQCDLGGMGRDTSEPVVCPVRWNLPIFGVFPWLLLAGAVWIERRSQRDNRWLVLVLAGGFVLLWILAKIMWFVPSQLLEVFGPVLQSLLFGIVMMGLLSTRLARPARGATFLGMLGVTSLSSGLMLYALLDIDDSTIVLPCSVILIIVWATTLISLKVAARLSRLHPRLPRFMLFLLLSCFGILFGLVSLIIKIESSNNAFPWALCLGVSGGLASGIVLALAPVLALWFLHPSQQGRLEELFHLAEIRQLNP